MFLGILFVFFMVAFDRASKDFMVLRNCSGFMMCLLGGNLDLRKLGIFWVGLYLDKSGLGSVIGCYLGP